MAKCEEGYLCEVCGLDVEAITDSALYLQFVIGWIDPETLHTRRDSHVRCLPTLAQFIDDSRFDPPVIIDGEMGKDRLDPDFVRQRIALVSRGYARLWAIFNDESPPPVTEYPLPEFIAQWR